MHVSVQALKPSKSSGCVSFCVELHHSVQRKKQMKMILNSCTYHQNYWKSSQKHQPAKATLLRWLLTKVIWMGQRKVKMKKLKHLPKPQKVFALLLYTHVLTGCASFCICWYFCVRNITKAGYLVLWMCVCNLLFW